MPIQAPQWTEFLSCPVCRHSFTRNVRPPISLGCGHTICQQCLSTLQRSQCPFDQTPFRTEPQNLPINYALLQLVLPTNNSSSSNNSAYDGQVAAANNNNNSSSVASLSSATTTSGLDGGGDSGTSNHSSSSSSGGSVETNNNNNNGSSSSKRDDPASAEIVSLSVRMLASDDHEYYSTAKECIEALALYLKPSPTTNASANLLTRQMQRKVVALICCQLFEEEGRSRAVRAARLLGERAVTELILHHQNPQQLSANLWAAVRARGCQFLGPAMQEEVLKLVLLALEDGSALSRKVLVMFVVQRLEPVYSQASKTSIGHVVQLLYRASCFKVSKREGDSSLMQLKEEFRTYEALRREHDTQIVQIATEAGLRIAPDQWSSLLYGDTTHKSHMQSINDKLQTPESFSQSVQELVLALQRTSDPAHLSNLQPCLKYLADIDPNAEQSVPTWHQVAQACSAVKKVVTGLADFVQHHGNRKLQVSECGQGTVVIGRGHCHGWWCDGQRTGGWPCECCFSIEYLCTKLTVPEIPPTTRRTVSSYNLSASIPVYLSVCFSYRLDNTSVSLVTVAGNYQRQSRAQVQGQHVLDIHTAGQLPARQQVQFRAL